MSKREKDTFSLYDELAIVINRYMSEQDALDFCSQAGIQPLRTAVRRRENRAIPKVYKYKM